MLTSVYIVTSPGSYIALRKGYFFYLIIKGKNHILSIYDTLSACVYKYLHCYTQVFTLLQLSVCYIILRV